MSSRDHQYKASLRWTGDRGEGTSSYASYGRDLEGRVPGAPMLPMSADPAFRGDAGRHNPENLLLLSISSCHMLWYLHLAAENGIVVRDYVDDCEAILEDHGRAGGQFRLAILRPLVRIAAGDPGVALALHEEAHRLCFIARSLNFLIQCEPTVEIHSEGA